MPGSQHGDPDETEHDEHGQVGEDFPFELGDGQGHGGDESKAEGLELREDAGDERFVRDIGPRVVAREADEHLVAGVAEAVARGDLQ